MFLIRVNAFVITILLCYLGKTLYAKEDLNDLYAQQPQNDLPDEKEDQVLNTVQVLLLTVNDNEFWATQSYMKPLKGENSIYIYYQSEIDPHSRSTQIYYLGLYGECIAAIAKIDPGAEVRTGAASAVKLAFKCFPHLGAIIAVGVACGVEGKSKMCDVLVSEKVIGYDKARKDKDGYIPRGESTQAGDFLRQIFTQTRWPRKSKNIESRFKQEIASLKLVPGIILSGPYLIDDKDYRDLLLKDFAKEAKGVEMEGCSLFAAAKGARVETIVIKAVCDFGNGEKNKIYQPTAAMLAADCVMHVLDNSKVAKIISPATKPSSHHCKLH